MKKNINLSLFIVSLYIIVMVISSSTGNNIVKIMRIITTLTLVLSIIKNKNRIRYSKKYIIWNVVFLLYCLVLCKFSYAESTAKTFWFTTFYIWILNLLLCIYFEKNNIDINYLYKLIIIGTTIKGGICYFRYGPMVFLNSRSTSAGLSANIIGLYSAISVVLCVFLFMKNKKNNESNFFNNILLIINIIFLVLSSSRKAVLFLIIPILSIFILKSKNILSSISKVLLSFFMIIIMLILIIKVDFLYDTVGHRIENMINGIFGQGEIDASTKTRFLLIENGMNWYKEKPLIGYGLGNYSVLFMQKYNWGIAYYAHNNYIELLVNTGIIGIMIYYSLFISLILMFISILKKRNENNALLFGVLISILICDFGMTSYYEFFTQFLILIVYFGINKYKRIGEEANENIRKNI